MTGGSAVMNSSIYIDLGQKTNFSLTTSYAHAIKPPNSPMFTEPLIK